MSKDAPNTALLNSARNAKITREAADKRSSAKLFGVYSSGARGGRQYPDPGRYPTAKQAAVAYAKYRMSLEAFQEWRTSAACAQRWESVDDDEGEMQEEAKEDDEVEGEEVVAGRERADGENGSGEEEKDGAKIDSIVPVACYGGEMGPRFMLEYAVE